MEENTINKAIDGELSVGKDLSVGGGITSQGSSHFKKNLKVSGWLEAKNIKAANKGLFTTFADLYAAYPVPENGWWAIVGTDLPAPIYTAYGGTWTATGGEGGNPTIDAVDLSASIEALEEAVTDLETDLSTANETIASLSSSSEQTEQTVLDLTSDQTTMNSSLTELSAEVFPLTVSFSGAGIYEVGSTPSISLVWSVSRKGSTVTPTFQTLNGELAISPKTVTPTATTSYELSVTYDEITKTASQTAQFVYASYNGVLASGATFANNVSSLTKVIKDTKALTGSYTLSNQCVVYAYPASFGDLSSIKDANGFEYIDSYTKTTAQYDEQTYNVYTMTNPTTISGLTQIFS
ncbi:MAG: hypothetical protein SNI70_06205 [Rikenellaceae bacterium]